MASPVLNEQELAELLRVPAKTVAALVARSDLPRFYVDGKLRFLTARVLAWFERHEGSDVVPPDSTRIFFWLRRYSRCGSSSFSLSSANFGPATRAMAHSMVVSSFGRIVTGFPLKRQRECRLKPGGRLFDGRQRIRDTPGRAEEREAVNKPPPSPLEAARQLAPRIRASADEIEANRELPRPLFEALADAGLFQLAVPRAIRPEGSGRRHFSGCCRSRSQSRMSFMT